MAEDFSKATPRPWVVLYGSNAHHDRPYQIVRDHAGPYHPVTRWGSTFCVPSLPEGQANAALIVAAVNGYDAAQDRIRDLEAALRELKELDFNEIYHAGADNRNGTTRVEEEFDRIIDTILQGAPK